MSEPKYVRVEREGEALIVSPLFTFARFTDDDIADEWKQVQQQIEGADVKHKVFWVTGCQGSGS